MEKKNDFRRMCLLFSMRFLGTACRGPAGPGSAWPRREPADCEVHEAHLCDSDLYLLDGSRSSTPWSWCNGSCVSPHPTCSGKLSTASAHHMCLRVFSASAVVSGSLGSQDMRLLSSLWCYVCPDSEYVFFPLMPPQIWQLGVVNFY